MAADTPILTQPLLPAFGAYTTREQNLAQQYATWSPYLRLENGLCRAFLQAGANPLEFEGVKILFPFVREAALLQTPPGPEHLNDWLHFAFLAGHDPGTHHPELLPDVLPDHELREGLRRLQLVQRLSDSEHASGRCLHHAFGRILQSQWPNVPPDRLDAVHAESALKSLRVGFAAATVALHDPLLCVFFGAIPSDARSHFNRILRK